VAPITPLALAAKRPDHGIAMERLSGIQRY
jgi:hypothetical protein